MAHLRRRAHLLVRLTRVNAALSRWHEREALAGLHRMLVEELRRLDGTAGDGRDGEAGP